MQTDTERAPSSDLLKAYTTCKARLKQCEERCTQYKTSLKTWKEGNDVLAKEIESLRQQVKSNQEEKIDLKSEIHSLKEDNYNLQCEIERLSQSLRNQECNLKRTEFIDTVYLVHVYETLFYLFFP